MEAVNNLLRRLPITPLLLLYGGWLCYNHYDWLNSGASQLGQRRAQLVTLRQDLEASKKKVAAAEEFYRTLELVRTRIRQLNEQLNGSKASLSTEVDIASLVSMLTLEAKKLSLNIKGIHPDPEVKKDYYVEVPFVVNFRGAYVQALVFFDRIAKFSQVIRVSSFDMKPTGNTLTKYVELEGTVKLLTYKYLGTEADQVIHKTEMSAAVDPSAAAAASSAAPAVSGGSTEPASKEGVAQ